jgi:sucrose phosphorylase
MSYIGSGENEAHLVYNFALPPLVLHTFHTGNAGALSSWASGLRVPSRETTFFNFLASHDGIGLSPSRGILTEGEIETLVVKTREHGGLVSYKQNPDGSQSPYELNINYFDALSSPNRDEPLDLEVDRFMAAQSIMLSLRGVPGIYFHSLFGSRGWPEGPQQTGHNRAINRQKLDWPGFRTELADPASRRRKVFNRYARMLRARRDCAAFHPNGEQEILDCGGSIFAVMRRDPATGQRALCLHNVTERAEPLRLDLAQALGHLSQNGRLFDLVTDRPIEVERGTPLRMNPYQTLWLVPEGQRG